MKHRKLGSTGLEVSVIGIGTYQFGGTWGKDFTQGEVEAIFDAAREGGINILDTAECYGLDHLSERLVGQAIRRDRERWVVATKFGHTRVDPLNATPALSPAEVRSQLEQSLRALQTDYIDLYQFHSGSNEAFDNEELWELLAREKEKGRIRHLGLSVSRKSAEWQAYQTRNASRVGAQTIQVGYNRLDSEAEGQVFPACLDQGLGVLARVPLASGLLSGKYGYELRFPPTDTRAKKHSPERVRQLIDEIQRLKREELPPGQSMAAWALSWCLRHPAVSCVIPGCKSPEHVRINASAADLVSG